MIGLRVYNFLVNFLMCYLYFKYRHFFSFSKFLFVPPEMIGIHFLLNSAWYLKLIFCDLSLFWFLLYRQTTLRILTFSGQVWFLILFSKIIIIWFEISRNLIISDFWKFFPKMSKNAELTNFLNFSNFV